MFGLRWNSADLGCGHFSIYCYFSEYIDWISSECEVFLSLFISFLKGRDRIWMDLSALVALSGTQMYRTKREDWFTMIYDYYYELMVSQ